MPARTNVDILHQRFINEADNMRNNLSGLTGTLMFFIVENPGINERRFLVLTDNNHQVRLKVQLNKFGGLSPTLGHGLPPGSALSPTEPVVIRRDIEYILSKERIFYTDVNLSSTSGIEVYFRIHRPMLEDKRKVIFLATDQQFADFNGFEVPLGAGIAKKPWELGGFEFFSSQEELAAAESMKEEKEVPTLSE